MSDGQSSSGEFQALLSLQEADTIIDQLTYRRSHLPGHLIIEDVQKRAAVLRPQMAEATAQRDAAAERQASLEAEVGTIQNRVSEINNRLYGNTPVGSKDAQAMSEEVRQLNERRSGLEDVELEVMEELEPLQARVDSLEAQAQELSKEMRAAQAEIEAGQAEIDVDLQKQRERRLELASAVLPALLADYERLRPSMGGVAVASVVGGSCGGCHLTLSASELAAIKNAPPSKVVNCEECGRILVH